MIAAETLKKLSDKYHSAIFPNIVREYMQHIFLSELYRLPESNGFLFKGGTALRIVYGSPRFSEDLDFSLAANDFWNGKSEPGKFVEHVFLDALGNIERNGIPIEIDTKSESTSGGYFGIARAWLLEYAPIGIEINVSARKKSDSRGEIDGIANDFVPTYNLAHLPQEEMVEEKIFGALLNRKKPRDFYDLYFMMRKGMVSTEQKKRLSDAKDNIIAAAKAIDFRSELEAFLPADHQMIIRDFARTLEGELNRQTA